MNAAETDKDRLAKLPVWVRDHIRRLEMRVQESIPDRQELCRKIDHLQKQLIRAQARLEAVEQLVTCAARGGHEDAKAYVAYIMAEYGPRKPEADGE